ncbi:MAG: undecaprenyl/decaprenyl-phosphate alpha-N-acetylglucosaminyl 1-phosphate transferase [Solirubrobacteraceae bacterium]|nr:undecaprenyl/decaprenyl-phosphate alpha-N-acetylglucosaminyl 1-phosphate transferase [Solirubrobacteraceae bacterium]
MTWRDPIVGLLVGFAVAAALTPLAARLARTIGVVDRPSDRGVARGGTPLLGGLAILAGVLVAVPLVLDGGRFEHELSPELKSILVGAVVITIVGAIDDRLDLHPLLKLLGQTGAACVPVTHGVLVANITFPFLGAVDFGGLGGPLTVLGFVAVMNVVNLSDGIDGLAAGVCAIAAVALGIVAWDLGRDAAGVLAAATCGAAVGFLVHNFHPARIFMGDAGANLLGYLLAAVAVEGSVKTQVVPALVIPLLVLALPFLDTTFVVLKRLRTGRLPWAPDQNHLHHRFGRLGFSQRRTVLYLYAWTAALAGLAVALRFVPYSPQPETYDWAWMAVMIGLALVVLAFSLYLVVVLEIVKLRSLGARRLRRLRPDVTDREIDADVERALETGEFAQITGERPSLRPGHDD